MNKTKILILYIAFFSFAGCKTAKIERLETVKDSSVIITRTIERPPILDSFTIFDICDTITNKPIQFKKQFIIQKDTFLVEVKDDDLQINHNIAKSVISKQDSIIKTKDTLIHELETKVSYRTPKWAWFTLGALSILIIFPNISKIINKFIFKPWI